IVQTKIDLVGREDAAKNYKEIKEFVKGTILENSPIIPVSAQQGVNIDSVIEAIEKSIPTPERDDSKELRMLVARSFDINRPGAGIKKLTGGVLGGSILQGKLKIGDGIEIRPGNRTGTKYKPILTKVVGLQKAGIDLEEAGPGGLLGVLTSLDPFITKSDSLVGNIVGLPGKLPETRDQLSLEIKLLERAVGLDKAANISPIKIGEDLMINVGTARSIGSVESMKKERMELNIRIPVCVEEKERIVVSRQISGRWRLIGFGTVI
ncbi:MAG TPA: translation initiation factor IF-2 subunit gamma, partial [archaeon]|nr:translation initiation factor IF-2 subunit gamma [archaeon]